MKALIIIVIGLVGSWWFTDVRSDSGFFNLFMPLCGVFFFIALMFWLVFALAEKRSSASSPSAVDMLSQHDGGGGDGGGGE